MKNPNSSYEINRALIEFEKWCANSAAGDIEQFLNEHDFSLSVATSLRDTVRVESNLRDYVTADDAVGSTRSRAASDLTGLVFGNYQFIRRLGLGGMGTVWLAEQKEPIQRNVAIKLIRPGMDSELFIRRFETERQALATMAHPHISKVFDAGTIDTDRPFFVMEYVPGIPITEYCNQNCLSLNQRLELFLQLCEAIQHAHQKSLLHRDIKPTNILVSELDGKAHVKVIDFGLSKFFASENEWNPQLTHAEGPLGSPLWMSPEQAAGRPGESERSVDTRSDIYSLGVILYQLLTDTTPISEDFYFDATPFQMLEAIVDQSPPYPSVRIAQSAEAKDWVKQKTSSKFSIWSSRLRNDLDWVTMKALEKDRERRYPTAAALANDIRRFMDCEPVIARPPALGYRLKKLASKYRGVAMTTVAIAALLLVATLVSAWLAVWAMNERAVADRERSRAEQIVDFVIREFGQLNVSNPGVVHDDFKQQFLLSLSDEINHSDFSDDPLTESSLRFALARSLSGSGQHVDAIREFERVVKITQKRLGVRHELAVSAKTLLAFEYLRIQQTDKAEVLAKECLVIANHKYGREHELSIGAELAMHSASLQRGEAGRVISKLESLARISKRSLGEGHPCSIETMAVLADALHEKQRYRESSQLFDKCRHLATKEWGADYKRTIELEVLYWEACARDYRFQKSPTDLMTFLERIVQKFGPGHPVTLKLQDDCGCILLQQGHHDIAAEVYQANLDSCRKYLGPDHMQTATALERLAYTNARRGDFDTAMAQMNDTIPMFASLLGEDSPEVIRSYCYIGQFHFSKHEFQLALDLSAKIGAKAIANLGRNHRTTMDLLDLQARSLVELGEIDKALPVFEANWQASCQHDGVDSIQAAQSLRRLATINFIAGKHQLAIEYYEKTFKIYQNNFGMRHSETHIALAMFVNGLLRQKKNERAEFYLRQALHNLNSLMPTYQRFKIETQLGLAEALAGQSRFAESKELVYQFFCESAGTSPKPHQLARANGILAACLVDEGEFREAEQLLSEAWRTLDSQPLQSQFRWYKTRCLERLVRLFETSDEPHKVDEYQKQLLAEQLTTFVPVSKPKR